MTSSAKEKFFYKECKFTIGAVKAQDIPATNLPEVAFIGRSNVGKSSLINALVNQNNIARVSQTPGRTRQINFFLLGDMIYLVDLPGYGYAKASKAEIKTWQQLINTYLQNRPQLNRVFLLVDSRHGIKNSDIEMITFLGECAVTTQIVLTKADKMKAKELETIVNNTQTEISKYAICHNEIIITSGRTKTGMNHLRSEIFDLACAR